MVENVWNTCMRRGITTPAPPFATPLDENGSHSSNGTAPENTIGTSSHHCKRINPESGLKPGSTTVSENNEPLPSAFCSKRQRTKSGTDGSSMDSGSAVITITDNSWNQNSSFNSKGELPSTNGVITTPGTLQAMVPPLAERNFRTKTDHLGVDQTDSVNNSNLIDNNCSTSSNSTSGILPCKNSSSASQPSNLYNNNNSEPFGVSNCSNNNASNQLENVIGSTNSGGLSPHCAATLEYVTRLPEGCTGTASSSSASNGQGYENSLQGSTSNNHDLLLEKDSDDELEDDDNYLDSSESEEEDLDAYTLPGAEDDESCGEDDQSVISSVTVGSTSSLRSIASETVSSIYMNENGVASNEDGSLLYNHTPAASPLPALNTSLFSNVPPTINFCKYNESTVALPEDISKFLKWRLTVITPLIVRKTILNSGFKANKKIINWLGTWGKHMKSPVFKGIKDYQKVNHFPGTFQVGRKDKLWKNFAKLQAKFGKEEFGFIPKTFVLPGDLKALKTAFDKEGVKKKWIVKPPAAARGSGIQVVNKWSQLPLDTPVVVQRYISRPYLINNTKFDIRIYVLVTSFHPLRVFLYEDGLVRFASVQYQKNSKTLSDRFMHLTNYSVNKTSSAYTHNDDAGHCQGHKWTLKTLWGYLKAQEIDTGSLWSRIADLVIKTMLAGENDVVARIRKSTKSMYNCFELFGFDVILDEKLNPWLLEVNISPSLHSASSLDHSVKGPLIATLLNLVGFHIPDKIPEAKQVELLKYLNMSENTSSLCLDRRIYTRMLTLEEQSKHVKINSMPRSQYLTEIFENLMPDDVRYLIISEDERNRTGKFTCIFPTQDTHHYFGFLSKTRYYNRLLDAWEYAYGDDREKGIALLEEYCKKEIHLNVTPRFKLPKTAFQPPAGGGLFLSPCQPSPASNIKITFGGGSVPLQNGGPFIPRTEESIFPQLEQNGSVISHNGAIGQFTIPQQEKNGGIISQNGAIGLFNIPQQEKNGGIVSQNGAIGLFNIPQQEKNGEIGQFTIPQQEEDDETSSASDYSSAQTSCSDKPPTGFGSC